VTARERIQHIRSAFPSEGLFQDKDWKLSPQPFALEPQAVEQIQALGPALQKFLIACDALYQSSAREDGWVARLLDQGKPAALIERARADAGSIPRVIRPDLLLTDTGVSIAEIDSVPGGIGLTAWLNQTYAQLGEAVIGSEQDMIQGFAAAFPQHQILVSTEASDYTPEMRWLADRLPWRPRVWHPRDFANAPHDAAYYRFFELFDLPEVEHAEAWLQSVSFTPPIKPYLEEKLWLALFHTPQLRSYWRDFLGEEAHTLLQQCIPQSWFLDPQPLPRSAMIPGLQLHSWSELKKLGRRARELVLKISGFSPLGWGSRGVHLGHDLSQAEWGAAVELALESFSHHPYVLQRFHRAKVVEHPAWHEPSGLVLQESCRARLCPYYFISGEQSPKLSGVLATLCPQDKKILHGMKDAMLLPCVVGTR
jgi:hypothetical protein